MARSTKCSVWFLRRELFLASSGVGSAGVDGFRRACHGPGEWSESSPEFLHGGCHRQWNPSSCDGLGSLQRNEKTWRYAASNDATCTDNGSRPDSQSLSSAAYQNTVRSYKGMFLDDHASGSAGVGDDAGSEADLNSFLDLDTLGVLVVDVDVVANEDTVANLYSAPSVERGANVR